MYRHFEKDKAELLEIKCIPATIYVCICVHIYKFINTDINTLKPIPNFQGVDYDFWLGQCLLFHLKNISTKG